MARPTVATLAIELADRLVIEHELDVLASDLARLRHHCNQGPITKLELTEQIGKLESPHLARTLRTLIAELPERQALRPTVLSLIDALIELGSGADVLILITAIHLHAADLHAITRQVSAARGHLVVVRALVNPDLLGGADLSLAGKTISRSLSHKLHTIVRQAVDESQHRERY
jgi:F0F1-type ATP synthase delta subunit